jgi:DNA-binding MarR family transcriptional regulator
MKYSPVSAQNAADATEASKMQAHHLRKIIDEFCTHLDRITLPEGEECFVNAELQKQVRAVIRARRARAEFFKSDLFADPAWDMLLELFASELSNQRMSVTALCAGSAVPATTALRWIRTLEHDGLVIRRPDPLDARRVFVSLSRTAYSAMAALFSSASGVAII